MKRGGLLSFLVGTISNVLVMEIGWTDVGSGGYILVSSAYSNTSLILFQVQWLLTMLDCSGFFSPLQMASEEKHPCTYLRVGRHKVIKQKLNHAETPALKTFYNNININDSIEVFHYAETTKGVYRDCTVEADHHAESACIVHYCNYVGRIGYFFHHSCSGTMHELSWINWIGHLKKGEESQCYFAEKIDIVQNPIVEVQELSAPLIYSVEDGIMWIPSLL